MPGSNFQIRLALVLYGGISLAVYMNGMAQELIALVRASHARKMAESDPESPFVQEQAAINPYYRLLEEARVDLVIDVIAGTSAGGLNGLILGKALAAGAPDLGAMTELWKQQAQVYKLATYDREPVSLFSGQMLMNELEKILQHLSQSADPALAEQVKVLDLFITATNVRGHRWSREDTFGQKLEGISHKYFFHLRKRTFDPETGRSYDQNDFVHTDPGQQARIDRILAKVGQATSALPPAFPPVQIGRAEAEAAGLDLLSDVEAPPEGVWFSDGGVLMNRPFEPVVQKVTQRSSTLPARRLLAYLDTAPDPVAAPEQKEPNLLENAMAGLTLTMQQDIADDLERLAQANTHRRELQNLVEQMDEAAGETEGQWSLVEQAAREMLAQAAPALELAPRPVAPPRTPRKQAPGEQTPVLESYYALRLARLKEGLRAGLGQALHGLEITGVRSDVALAALLAEFPWLDAPPGDPAVSALLARCDTEYQQRRLHFLLTRVQRQYRPGAVPSDPEAMERLMGGLWGALEDWRNAAWFIAHAGRLGSQPEPWSGAAARLDRSFLALKQAAQSAPRVIQGVSELKLAAREVAAALEEYLELVWQRTEAEVRRALEAARAALPLRDFATGQPIEGVGSPELTPERLERTFAAFESRDLILFPLKTYGSTGDWETVDLLQLGATGAQGWVRKRPEEKLTGLKLYHFGAFFDKRWRANDMMWGRLDAAELLTRMVVTQAGLLKPGTKPPSAHEMLPESAYSEPAARALAARRRQIVGSFPELIQLDQVRRAILESGAELKEGEPVPDWALQRYLQEQYKITPGGVEGLPPKQLAAEVLIVLHNLLGALERSGTKLGGAEKVMLGFLRPLNWVARLVLVPRDGLFGIVQGNAAALMTVVGIAMVALHVAGAIQLATSGWGAVLILLSPAIMDSLFRPTPLRLALSAALAMLSGGAALARAQLPALLGWLAPVQQFFAGMPEWLSRLAGAWGFFLALFAALTVAFVADRRTPPPAE